MARRVMARAALVLAVLFVAIVRPFPASAQGSWADLAVEVGSVGQGQRYAYLTFSGTVSLYVSAYVVAAEPVDSKIDPPIVIDPTHLSSRVALGGPLPGCTVDGAIWTCSHISGPDGSTALMLPIVSAPGAAPGPAGSIEVRVDPTPGTDPNPANNTATIDVDVVSDATTTATWSAPTVTGSVGRVVTVPVKIHNNGPDTLPSIAVTQLAPLPGAEYLASAGCTTSSGTVTCERKNVLAGTTYTVDIALRVVSCPPSGTTGAQFTWSFVDIGQLTLMPRQQLTVRCGSAPAAGAAPGGGSTAAGPSTSASPDASAGPSFGASASAVESSVAPEITTRVAGGRRGAPVGLVVGLTGVPLAAGVTALLLVLLRQRRRLVGTPVTAADHEESRAETGPARH